MSECVCESGYFSYGHRGSMSQRGPALNTVQAQATQQGLPTSELRRGAGAPLLPRHTAPKGSLEWPPLWFTPSRKRLGRGRGMVHPLPRRVGGPLAAPAIWLTQTRWGLASGHGSPIEGGPRRTKVHRPARNASTAAQCPNNMPPRGGVTPMRTRRHPCRLLAKVAILPAQQGGGGVRACVRA